MNPNMAPLMKSFFVCSILFGLCTGTFASDPEANDAGGKSPPKNNKPKFTIGKETTFVAGPVDKDGFIDYVAAVNERLGKGVTAENNAAVLFWKAIGPAPLGKARPSEFFKLLGMDQLPARGEYFVSLNRFLTDKLMVDPSKAYESEQRMDSAFHRPWAPKDFPDLVAWLNSNEKPLALIIEASNRRRYFVPCCSSSDDGNASIRTRSLSSALTVRHTVTERRAVTRALICRSLQRLGASQFEEAWQDLLAAHRLARLFGQEGTMMDSIVGIACDLVTGRAELIFLEQAKFDANRVQKCLSDLQALPPLPNIADNVEWAERFLNLDYVTNVAHGDISQLQLALDYARNNFDKASKRMNDKAKRDPSIVSLLDGVDWDSHLREINREFDREVAIMREPKRALRERQFDVLEAELQQSKKEDLPEADDLVKMLERIKGDPGAKDKLLRQIFTSPGGSQRSTQTAADRAEQNQRNLHIAFALGAYQRDRGSYPKTLDALAPKYLAKVPDDLFTGKPLAYRPDEKGYLLYSFGPNGKDDNGRALDEDPPGDDLSVRMPIPELRKK
jgi:hypothetical protein